MSWDSFIYCRNVDIPRASATQDNGGDKALVLVFPSRSGPSGLQQMEIQMDSLVQLNNGSSIHLCQSL